MSTHYWSDDGYGAYTRALKPTTEGFVNVLKASNQIDDFVEYLKYDEVIENDINKNGFDINKIAIDESLTVTYGEFEVDSFPEDDWECYGGSLVYGILKEAINKDIESITGEKYSVEYCHNDEGDEAIIYIPTYPWCIKRNNIKLIDEEEYKEIFVKWFKMIGTKNDADNLFDRCQIEQWG